VRDLGERAGIKGLHPHALRHACAVELLKRTKNLRAVQQHLRHRDIQSTTVYARLVPGDLAEAVSAPSGGQRRQPSPSGGQPNIPQASLVGTCPHQAYYQHDR